MKLSFAAAAISLSLFLGACTSALIVDEIPENNLIVTDTISPTWTIQPTATEIPATSAPSLQSTICSPLETESIQSLSEIITNPYKQPRIGIDDGPPTHHGVDFAHYRRGNLLSVEGVAIQSALDGEVVTIIKNRYPYGFAVLIETPLRTIEPDLLAQFNLPQISPTVIPDPKFKWEPGELPFELSETERSIYIIYAHLLAEPDIQVGDKVSCGQRIGQVGNSGDSTNAHLHFETRIGPSGARFESMAYYITQSTASERYNYVVWRQSNLFQVFDPLLLLNLDG